MDAWDARVWRPMQLRLNDPGYTDRLANFLRSLGQAAIVAGPGQLDVDLSADVSAREELEIYLRVWRVLYPDAEVQVESDEGESPAA
jgi:hypothetical protein